MLPTPLQRRQWMWITQYLHLQDFNSRELETCTKSDAVRLCVHRHINWIAPRLAISNNGDLFSFKRVTQLHPLHSAAMLSQTFVTVQNRSRTNKIWSWPCKPINLLSNRSLVQTEAGTQPDTVVWLQFNWLSMTVYLLLKVKDEAEKCWVLL